MRKIKVYGGLTFVDGKQVRTIVATTTKKRAMELLDITITELNNYWCETGNSLELNIALNELDTVFVATSSMGRDFKQLVK